MALATKELALHRLGTQHFIAADPTEITLIPSTSAMVAGTKTFTPGVPRAAQTFKVIWSYDNGFYRQVGIDGAVHRFDFILLGEYDSTIVVGDYWESGTQRYQIEYVFPGNGYEVKAGGISHGGKP